MPPLQKQAEDLPDPHPLCRQATLPRAGLDEHCGKALYEALGDYSAISRLPWRKTYPTPRSSTLSHPTIYSRMVRAYQDSRLFALGQGSLSRHVATSSVRSFLHCDGVGWSGDFPNACMKPWHQAEARSKKQGRRRFERSSCGSLSIHYCILGRKEWDRGVRIFRLRVET